MFMERNITFIREVALTMFELTCVAAFVAAIAAWIFAV